MCPSCSTSNTLTSVISVVITALLATVIFVLALIAVCKCHPKFTQGGAETGTSAGGEGHVYEQMDGGDGGVAVSDPWRLEQEEEEEEEGTPFNSRRMKLMLYSTYKIM